MTKKWCFFMHQKSVKKWCFFIHQKMSKNTLFNYFQKLVLQNRFYMYPYLKHESYSVYIYIVVEIHHYPKLDTLKYTSFFSTSFIFSSLPFYVGGFTYIACLISWSVKWLLLQMHCGVLLMISSYCSFSCSVA